MERKTEPHDLLVALLLVESLMERRSESFFQGFGLTAAQFNILNLLGYHGTKMDQSSLVERLLVGKSTVSIVLNRMVRNGLVQRGKHLKDRRQVVLKLTPKGRSLWQKISPIYETNVEKIFGALPNSRRHQFIADLKTLYDAFLAEEGIFENPWLKPFFDAKAKS